MTQIQKNKIIHHLWLIEKKIIQIRFKESLSSNYLVLVNDEATLGKLC